MAGSKNKPGEAFENGINQDLQDYKDLEEIRTYNIRHRI